MAQKKLDDKMVIPQIASNVITNVVSKKLASRFRNYIEADSDPAYVVEITKTFYVSYPRANGYDRTGRYTFGRK